MHSVVQKIASAPNCCPDSLRFRGAKSTEQTFLVGGIPTPLKNTGINSG